MLKIGKQEVLLSKSLILDLDEDIWVTVPSPTWEPKFHIILTPREEDNEIKANAIGKGDHGEIKITYEKNGFSGINQLKVATANGLPIYFVAHIDNSVPKIIITFQFCLGEEGESK